MESKTRAELLEEMPAAARPAEDIRDNQNSYRKHFAHGIVIEVCFTKRTFVIHKFRDGVGAEGRRRNFTWTGAGIQEAWKNAFGGASGDEE